MKSARLQVLGEARQLPPTASCRGHVIVTSDVHRDLLGKVLSLAFSTVGFLFFPVCFSMRGAPAAQSPSPALPPVVPAWLDVGHEDSRVVHGGTEGSAAPAGHLQHPEGAVEKGFPDTAGFGAVCLGGRDVGHSRKGSGRPAGTPQAEVHGAGLNQGGSSQTQSQRGRLAISLNPGRMTREPRNSQPGFHTADRPSRWAPPQPPSLPLPLRPRCSPKL